MERGIDTGDMLDGVQGGNRTRAEWMQAVDAVGPLKLKLQGELLPAARKQRQSFLQRRFSSSAASSAPGALAPSAGEMDVDELRLCQVWLYGLASRLSRCKKAASALADGVGMGDPNKPLENYASRRWDPSSPIWQEMEACVHLHAARSGAEADLAWRGRPKP